MRSISCRIKSLRGMLSLSLLLLVVLTAIIIGIPMIKMIRRQVDELAKQQTGQVLDHLEQSVYRSASRIFRLSDQLLELEHLRLFLSRDSDGNAVIRDLDGFLTGRFRELVRIYNDITAIFAFEHGARGDGALRYVSTRDSLTFNEDIPLTQETWYTGAIEAEGAVVITAPHLQNFIKRNYIWVVSFSRSFLDPSTGEANGVLLIDINIDLIKDICIKNSTPTHYYFLIDPSGTIVFHPYDELISSDLFTEPVKELLNLGRQPSRLRIDGRDRVYQVRDELLTGWRIIAVTDVKELYAPFPPPPAFMALWVGLGILFLIFVSRLISSRVLHPIQSLRESMKEVENGHFNISVRVPKYAEVGALARDFSIMIQKISDLIDLNEKEHRKLRISDFRALQNQINPHFLYNTLDSVIWMAAKNRNEDVITMISSLSKLLRRSLATGESLVRLEEEYEHARQYCIIQKIRYGDQLNYSLTLPEDCKSFLVPRLILQPIIENSLLHGMDDWNNGGSILIDAIKHGNRLEIVVSDNGAGADTQALERVLIDDKMEGRRNSVGLKNINDRLKILFGNQAGITFQSKQRHGLNVIISVPLCAKAPTPAVSSGAM